MTHIETKADTLNELFWKTAQENPDDVFLRVPEERGTDVVWIDTTYKEFAQRVFNLKQTLLTSPFNIEPHTVVGILSWNAPTYLELELALWDMGCTVFTINVRLADDTVVSLLQASNTKWLMVPGGPYLNRAVNNILPKLPELRVGVFDFQDAVVEGNVFPIIPVKDALPIADNLSKTNDTAIIMHTSGTTKLPKLVPITHFNMLYNLAIFEARSEVKQTKNDCLLGFLPYYHLMGIMQFIGSVYRGSAYPLAYMPDRVPSGEHILFSIRKTGITFMSSVPFVLQDIVNLGEYDQTVFDTLRSLKFISSGGVQLPEKLGETLANQDVKVLQMYGLTEVGVLMCGDLRENWKYMRLIPGSGAVMRHGEEENVYELVVVNGPGCFHSYLNNPSATHEAFEQPGEFHTHDLFREVKAGLFHYLGRKDDLLVHVTGEKTNPIAMETIMDKSVYVKKSAAIGHNRPYVIMLIQLDDLHIKDTPMHQVKAEIERQLEVMNKEIPEYSRVLPKNLIFLDKDQQLPLSPKKSLIRSEMLRKFKDLIDKLYAENEMTSISALPTDPVDIKIKKIIEKIFGTELSPEASLLDYGLDSLTAVQLQTTCINVFGLPPQYFSPTLLYKFAKVSDLITYTTEITSMNPEERMHHFSLLSSLDQYEVMGKNLPECVKSGLSQGKLSHVAPSDGAILLTGARGFLGIYILSELLKSQQPIYCVVRSHGLATDDSIKNQLASLLEQRKIQYDKGNFQEQVRILVGDVNDPFIGQTEEKFNQLCREVSCIVHCAWEPNLAAPFPLQEIHLKGTKNLLQMASSFNLKEFNFISSVSAHFRHPAEAVPEGPSETVQDAMPIGYGITKWIAEQWTYQSSLLGLKTRTFIVGYISGSTETGAWNRTDTIPRVFEASIEQQLIPDEFGDINWIPANVCASTIVNISLQGNTGVYHVVNPVTFPWSDAVSSLKKAYPSMKVLPVDDWWKYQFEIRNEKIMPLFSWNQQSKEKGILKPFEVKRTSGELRKFKVSYEEQTQITEDVLQKYWNYFKEGIVTRR